MNPSTVMSRQRVIGELRAITPADDAERRHWTDAMFWAKSGAPLFRTAKPATPNKHLVSYFAVVDDGHILLVDHKNAQMWLPTGGHVESDEHPRRTVVRELWEELGIEVSLEAVAPPLMVTVTETVGLTAGHTDVSLWYAINFRRGCDLDFNKEEFFGVRWFTFTEAATLRSDPHLKRFLDKLILQPPCQNPNCSTTK